MYGIRPWEIDLLTIDELESLYSSMDAIESRWVLYLLKASDFPHLKQSDRRKVHREVYLRAVPFMERKSVTFQELQAMLSGRVS